MLFSLILLYTPSFSGMTNSKNSSAKCTVCNFLMGYQYKNFELCKNSIGKCNSYDIIKTAL
jgi:hypothetical protein